jgi:IclR family transcriptional regulator, KDG regulon repressor
MNETPLVPAIDRAVALLSLFKNGQPDWSLAELHQRLGLPKSTVHTIMATLAHHGYLERDPATRRYRLGAALLELAHYVPNQPRLPDLARPHVLRLRDTLGETAALGVYVDGHATLLEIAESHQLITISAPIGKRLPLDAGCFGKLYLAALDIAALNELLAQRPPRAYTSHTIADPQRLRAELEMVRAQGYAADDQEYLDDVWAAAAPVWQGRRLAAAVAVIGIARRMDAVARARAIEDVRAAAAAISQPSASSSPLVGQAGGR